MRGRRFEGANFTRADLRSADFTGAWMKKAIFRGADLANAKFGCPPAVWERSGDLTESGCTQLQGADFKGANMSGAMLKRALLQGAEFAGTDLQNAVLEGARLQAALIKSSNLLGASLKDANLTAASIAESQLRAADMSGANLSGALIFKSHLQGAILWRNDGSAANLETAALVDVNVWNLDDSHVDWATTIVKDLKSSGDQFDIASVMRPFSVASAGAGALEQSEVQKRLEALDPENCKEGCQILRSRKAEEISLKGIRNYPKGGMESDSEAWRKRVTKQVALMCYDKFFGGDVLARIAFNRGSNRDKRIFFGPYLNATAALLQDPKQCPNSPNLVSEYGAVLAEWAGDGISKAALLYETNTLKAKAAAAAGK
jgi:uncharacterized protein YjbI with pentapeptide repeats